MSDSSSIKDLCNLTDPELMRQTADGSEEAFSALVRRHQVALVNFFRRLGVYSEAEDLVQETFVRLFKYRHKYTASAKFTTFMYMCARQIRMDLLRKLRRRDELGRDLLIEATQKEAQGARVPRTGGVDLEIHLGKLSEPLREVVILNIYQGLQYQEIADVLEIPTGTVKSRMFNALRELREMINAKAK